MSKNNNSKKVFGVITIVSGGNFLDIRYDYSRHPSIRHKYTMNETFYDYKGCTQYDGISTTIYYDDEIQDFYDEVSELSYIGKRINLIDDIRV